MIAGGMGLGAMFAALGGNRESAAAMERAIGKRIAALNCGDERLRIVFDDGTAIEMFDDAQSCCEHRYMRTDDDLAPFVGATLLNAETREVPTAGDDYAVKDCEFLVVTTSLGAFTVANYNEHNGYYGGFAIRVRGVAP